MVSVRPGLKNTRPGSVTPLTVGPLVLFTVTVEVSAICSLTPMATVELFSTSRSPAIEVAPPVRSRPIRMLPRTVVRPV